MPHLDGSPQKVFADFISATKKDPEISDLLTVILSLEQRLRKENLDALLQHPKFQDRTDELKDIFTYLLDDGFAREVLEYLKHSADPNQPEQNEVRIPEPCQFKIIIEGKVIACQENKPFCRYSFAFGNGIFCSNPEPVKYSE